MMNLQASAKPEGKQPWQGNGRNGLKTRIIRLQIYSISTDVFDDDRPSTLRCSTILRLLKLIYHLSTCYAKGVTLKIVLDVKL